MPQINLQCRTARPGVFLLETNSQLTLLTHRRLQSLRGLTLTKNAISARLRRKEDDRFLHGRGQYIGDIRFPKMRDVAFVRSPVAHARLTGVHIPERLRSSVFSAWDLTNVRPIRAVSPLSGFQASEQPALVSDKIRQVGELIAFCVADTRAQAEDIAAQVIVEYEELPAVVDMDAQKPDSTLVHDTVKGTACTMTVPCK
jgi:aerobic carbon-monoxide dehydrogenase large subunit